MQRYLQHFPAAGEIVIFDRSWYNRAGVEYVMGFCTKEQHQRFLELCPIVEKYVVDGGIRTYAFWYSVKGARAKLEVINDTVTYEGPDLVLRPGAITTRRDDLKPKPVS